MKTRLAKEIEGAITAYVHVSPSYWCWDVTEEAEETEVQTNINQENIIFRPISARCMSKRNRLFHYKTPYNILYYIASACKWYIRDNDIINYEHGQWIIQ